MQVFQIPNPFVSLFQSFDQLFVPVMSQYLLNRNKINQWSDTSLSDQKKTLQEWNSKYAPGILDKNGGLDMNKINYYYKKGNAVQQAIAKQILDVIDNRKQLAEMPIIGKVQALQNPNAMDMYGLTLNPEAIEKTQDTYTQLSKQFQGNKTLTTLLKFMQQNNVPLSNALPVIMQMIMPNNQSSLDSILHKNMNLPHVQDLNDEGELGA